LRTRRIPRRSERRSSRPTGPRARPPTLVAQFEQVTEYCAEHPDQGSGAVATALDLPRERIRAWVDSDGRPDAVRGCETLTANGWLHLSWAAAPLLDGFLPR
jgi:hypothetical protein